MQEESSDKIQEKICASFRKMSASFAAADISKVEECFENLHQMKDNNIFKDLTELSKEGTTFATVRSIRVILVWSFLTDETVNCLFSPYFVCL